MKPRLLLVEDDSISCSFMAAALQALPAEVETADSMHAALARQSVYDLWLLDVNLPDGRGTELLAELRNRFPRTPALAHTADDSPALRTQLLVAGFDGVLVKPLSAAQLRQATVEALGLSSCGHLPAAEATGAPTEFPLWDQTIALAALNGNQEHVATLRRMFLEELAKQRDDIQASLRTGELEAAKQVLHQLKASSGFVGAVRLQAAAAALEKSPLDSQRLELFAAAVRDTAAAPPP